MGNDGVGQTQPTFFLCGYLRAVCGVGVGVGTVKEMEPSDRTAEIDTTDITSVLVTTNSSSFAETVLQPPNSTEFPVTSPFAPDLDYNVNLPLLVPLTVFAVLAVRQTAPPR